MATLTIDADAVVGTAGHVPVLIYLSDLNSKRVAGTVGGSVTVATRTLRTDALGQLAVDLPPTATVDQPGTFYTVQVNGERFLIIKGAGTETLVEAAEAVGNPVALPEGSRFNDLADVNAPTPTNGQVPVFDTATNSWIPGTVSGSGLTPAPDLTVLGNVSGISAVPTPLTSTQQRTAAGLGNSATRAVGTAAGDVAAGNTPAVAQAAAIAAAASDATTKADAAKARAVHTGTQTMSTVSDAGTAATKNVGVGAGDVAAGNAPATAEAAAIATASSDATTKADAAKARAVHTGTQLMATVSDAGTAATKNVGTGAGDVAAGNAPAAAQAAAIAVSAQRASNLSDLANAGTSRTNLGLGNSATRAVGATSADVAQGDAPAAAQAAAIATAAGDATTKADAAKARATHTGTQLMNTISNAGGAAVLNVGTSGGTVAAGDAPVAAIAAATLDNLFDVTAAAATFDQTVVYDPATAKFALNNRLRTAQQRVAETLRGWHAKWDSVRTSKAVVVFLGASESWSFGSSHNATDGLTDIVRIALSSQAGFPAAGQGWVPAYSDSGIDLGGGNTWPYAWGRSSGASTPWVPTGTQDPLSGLGGWGSILNPGQAPPADTKTCTGVDFYFTVQKTAPAASVQMVVDGTPTGPVVSTLDATIPTGTKESGRKLISWTGTGTHTFTFVVTGTGTAIFDGGYIHNGTQSVGPQVHNGGHGGAEFADFITGGVYFNGSIDHIKNVQPDLVIVTFGLNDAFKGKTSAQVKTGMDSLIAGIKVVAPNVSILVNFEWRGGIAGGTPKTPPSLSAWLYEWRPLFQQAADTAGAALLDWFEILGDLYLPGGAVDNYSLLFSDALHPNPKGYRLVAQAIIEKILPNGVAIEPRHAHRNPVPSCAAMNTIQQAIPNAVWTPLALMTNISALDTDLQHPLVVGVSTTIAAGSNAVALPTATINVASTTGFPTASASRPRFAVINGPFAASTLSLFSYTGMTGTTFTGCTLGAGTMATGQVVTPANESFVFNTAGTYSTTSTVTFPANATGARGVRLNMWRSDASSGYPGGTMIVPTTNTSAPFLQGVQATAPHTVTAAFKAVSFLRTEVYQSSGATMTIPIDVVQAPAMSIGWFGPAVDGV